MSCPAVLEEGRGRGGDGGQAREKQLSYEDMVRNYVVSVVCWEGGRVAEKGASMAPPSPPDVYLKSLMIFIATD
jgi:hypothetical protein